jgi:very-short-patch-repair endonuclease
LRHQGWKVIRIKEHELKPSATKAVEKIAKKTKGAD